MARQDKLKPAIEKLALELLSWGELLSADKVQIVGQSCICGGECTAEGNGRCAGDNTTWRLAILPAGQGRRTRGSLFVADLATIHLILGDVVPHKDIGRVLKNPTEGLELRHIHVIVWVLWWVESVFVRCLADLLQFRRDFCFRFQPVTS